MGRAVVQPLDDAVVGRESGFQGLCKDSGPRAAIGEYGMARAAEVLSKGEDSFVSVSWMLGAFLAVCCQENCFLFVV